MEGSASQTHCTSRQRRMERCSGKNSRVRRGNVGARGGRSEQITGSDRRKTASGRGTSEPPPSGQHSHLRLANKQDPGVPSTFTGCPCSACFQWKKIKTTNPPSPPTVLENQERKPLAAWQKWALYLRMILFWSFSVLFFSLLARNSQIK